MNYCRDCGSKLDENKKCPKCFDANKNEKADYSLAITYIIIVIILVVLSVLPILNDFTLSITSPICLIIAIVLTTSLIKKYPNNGWIEVIYSIMLVITITLLSLILFLMCLCNGGRGFY